MEKVSSISDKRPFNADQMWRRSGTPNNDPEESVQGSKVDCF